MHFGYNNPQNTFLLGGHILATVFEDRDFDIIVRNDLKVSGQCVKGIKTANQVLGMIKETFFYKTIDSLLPLYKSLVRPHLEYCMQAWSPHLRKDIDLEEGVERRATNMVLGWDKHSYSDRLTICDLLTLEDRRLRGDLIQVFKILKGFHMVNYQDFFELDQDTSRRGHTLKLVKPRARLDIRNNFFSYRILNSWNKLPTDVVNCLTVNSFKNKLSTYLISCNSG